MNSTRIPDEEYAERRMRAARIASERGLDVLIFSSNESDFADVRYFTGFYTVFERASVIIAANGNSALVVGPEGRVPAEDRSQLKNIFPLYSHRESSNPSYPELNIATFRDVFHSLGVTCDKINIGIGSFLYTSVEIYLDLRKDYPHADIIHADDIVMGLRKKKSENELNCLRAAFGICEKAVTKVLEEMRPGMSECNVAGIAIRYIYEFGAEDQGMPQMVLSDKATRHAISRPKANRILDKNSFVSLGIAARVDGYASAIGIPVAMGKFTREQLRFVEFGRDVHEWIKPQLREGVIASDIARRTVKYYQDHGFIDNYLYGPMHGIGIIEAEPPAVETDSNYAFEENYCYQVDNFLFSQAFGLRWEEGIRITKDGYEMLNSSPICRKIYELGF